MEDAIKDMLEDFQEQNTIEYLVEHIKNKKRLAVSIIPTLRDIVIENVVKNIKIWMSEIAEDSSNYLYILSPFDCLSTKDTLDIFDCLHRKNHVYHESHYMNLFLHQNLTKFDLTKLSLKNRISGLKILLDRCKRIKDFTIPQSPAFPLNSLNKISKYLKKLEHYNIDSYNVNDIFMKTLTKNCVLLKTLELSCKRITQDGFKLFGKCCQLQKLTLNQPMNLNCDTLVEILQKLEFLKSLSLKQCTISFHCIPDYLQFERLIHLNVYSTGINDQGLQKIVKAMPNITSLNISSCTDLSTECFNSITKLQYLVSLSAAYICSLSENYSFTSNIELFLIKCGFSLQFLDLSGICNINTSVLAKCCPNIIELIVCDCKLPNISWINKNELALSQNHFAYLLPFEKELYSLLDICYKLQTFTFTCDGILENEMLMLCAGHKNSLKKFTFRTQCPQLDEMLISVLHQCCFDNLRCLDLSGSLDISNKTVYTILMNYPNLKELKLLNCKLLPNEIKDIKKVKMESKLETLIHVNSVQALGYRYIPSIIF